MVGRELSCWVFRPALCLAQCLVDTQYMRAAAEELRALGCLYKLTLVLSNFEIIGKLLFFFSCKTWQMHWTTHYRLWNQSVYLGKGKLLASFWLL